MRQSVLSPSGGRGAATRDDAAVARFSARATKLLPERLRRDDRDVLVRAE